VTTSTLTVLRPGLVDYRTAWSEQRRLHDAVVAGDQPDTILLLEHPSVFTAGKRTEPADRPIDGTPVVDVDRGGKITWHGPGQLVGYPIIRLTDPVDVVAYVRRVEQLLIDVCAGSRAAAAPGCSPTTAARTARSRRSASGWRAA
jgi:lipoyl(octanoyl) transferase